MLPIFVFGTLLMLWSREALSPSPNPPKPKEEAPTKLTIEVVTPESK